MDENHPAILERIRVAAVDVERTRAAERAWRANVLGPLYDELDLLVGQTFTSEDGGTVLGPIPNPDRTSPRYFLPVQLSRGSATNYEISADEDGSVHTHWAGTVLGSSGQSLAEVRTAIVNLLALACGHDAGAASSHLLVDAAAERDRRLRVSAAEHETLKSVFPEFRCLAAAAVQSPDGKYVVEVGPLDDDVSSISVKLRPPPGQHDDYYRRPLWEISVIAKDDGTFSFGSSPDAQCLNPADLYEKLGAALGKTVDVQGNISDSQLLRHIHESAGAAVASLRLKVAAITPLFERLAPLKRMHLIDGRFSSSGRAIDVALSDAGDSGWISFEAGGLGSIYFSGNEDGTISAHKSLDEQKTFDLAGATDQIALWIAESGRVDSPTPAVAPAPTRRRGWVAGLLHG